MNFSRRVSVANCLIFIILSACAPVESTSNNVRPSSTWVATPDVKGEYDLALKRWQRHNIPNYEITVDVFSSMLAPPCWMKATLIVRNNKLVEVRELQTPVPLQDPNGGIMFHPECEDYERYIVSNQFELFEKLYTDQLKFDWKVKFNTEYGYISELLYTTGYESTKTIKYSDFKIK